VPEPSARHAAGRLDLLQLRPGRGAWPVTAPWTITASPRKSTAAAVPHVDVGGPARCALCFFFDVGPHLHVLRADGAPERNSSPHPIYDAFVRDVAKAKPSTARSRARRRGHGASRRGSCPPAPARRTALHAPRTSAAITAMPRRSRAHLAPQVRRACMFSSAIRPRQLRVERGFAQRRLAHGRERAP